MTPDREDDITSETANADPVRPALIVSRGTIDEYPGMLRKMLVGLSDEPVSVAVVCPPDYVLDTVISSSVEVIRHPYFDTPFLFFQNYKILLDKLYEFNPNVLHCLCTSRAHLTRRVSRELSLPYILSINSFQKRYRLSVSSTRCARITVPAQTIAANVTKTFPKFVGRVEHINIGTFPEEQICCFEDNRRLVSMVTDSTFLKADDFECLLGAVRHLTIEGYEFLLVIISESGRHERQLRSLIRVLGLNQHVIIIPKLEPWRSILSACDIFIQTQPSDSFNPLLLEAMSAGVAIAGCKGGVDDLIIEDETAEVFDPDDELSIYSALQRMLDAREITRRLAQNAQQYVRNNHSVSRMISQLLEVYRSAIRSHKDRK